MRITSLLLDPVHFMTLRRTAHLLLAGLGFGIAGLSSPALGQTTPQANIHNAPTVGEAVAATVNDEMISTFDVRQRVRLMVLMSGGRVPDSAMDQLQKQALKDLVEERLKLQEAERLEFEIDPAEVDEELSRIAATSKLTKDDLVEELESQGIAIETVRDQIKARLTWQRIVSGRFGNRVRITEQQVDNVYGRLLSDSRQEQYLVSEICLPMEDESKAPEIYRAGLQMIEQMRRGVPFEAVARQFSVCSTAQSGGDLGWIHSGELAPELDRVLANLQPGAVSVPTPYEGTLYILAVRKKRGAGEKSSEPAYSLVYAGVPMSVGKDRAREIFAQLPKTNACESSTLAVDLGPDVQITALPMLRETQIQEVFRPTLEKLQRGDVMEPIAHDGAYHSVLLCEKDEGFGLPSRRQIEERLSAQQLNLMSRRYLRDVERSSSVDYRISVDEEEAPVAG